MDLLTFIKKKTSKNGQGDWEWRETTVYSRRNVNITRN